MAKYINADLLRKEIESRMGECDANSKNPNQLLWAELAALLPLIDSLQQEQPCEGYDEAYLQEKIALKEKHGSWKDGIKQLEYLNKIYFKEQPSEELEKEIENTIDNTFCDMNGIAYLGITGYATVEDMKYIARHFYELGKQSKEPVNEDLEAEIKRYEASLPESATVDPFEGHPTLEDVARHFANWQKEQMIQDCSVQASYEAEIEKAEERGYNLCKEQMLKDAVDANIMLTLHDKTGDVSLHTGFLPKELGIKYDDKVKIVVIPIKEDKK